jgi:hypothetical protein
MTYDDVNKLRNSDALPAPSQTHGRHAMKMEGGLLAGVQRRRRKRMRAWREKAVHRSARQKAVHRSGLPKSCTPLRLAQKSWAPFEAGKTG